LWSFRNPKTSISEPPPALLVRLTTLMQAAESYDQNERKDDLGKRPQRRKGQCTRRARI
jgi:hypothetical protein